MVLLSYAIAGFLLPVLCIPRFVNCDLKITPEVNEVMVGQSTYFSCSTSIHDTNVNWYFYAVGAKAVGETFVYFSGELKNKYKKEVRIDKISTGVWNLVILNVSLEDAGRYACQDVRRIEVKKTAQLVVLATDPTCRTNINMDSVVGPNTCGIEPDELVLSCSVTYRGEITPKMEWKLNGNNESLDNLTTIENVGGIITFNLTTKADLQMSDRFYICETTRSMSHQYNCTTDVINVLYVFNDSLIVNASMDDQLVCSANKSEGLVCRYKWKWFESENSSSEYLSQTLKPTESRWYRCEATCNIKEHTCTIRVKDVYVFNRKKTGCLKTIIAVLWTVSFLTFATAVGIFIRNKWKKRNQEKMYPGRAAEELSESTSSCLNGGKSLQNDKNHIRTSRLHICMVEFKRRFCEAGWKVIVLLLVVAFMLFILAVVLEAYTSNINGTCRSQKEVIEEAIRMHRTFLEKRIDPDFGILDRLPLTQTERISIEVEGHYSNRNARLLEYVLNRRKFDLFVEALKNTQRHIVNYLLTNGIREPLFGDEWPLTENVMRILDGNWNQLLNILEAPDVTKKLHSDNVISERHYRYISESHDMNEALLSILKRHSLQVFKRTIQHLRETDQTKIASLLENGGFLFPIVVKFEVKGGYSKETDEKILALLKELSEQKGNTSTCGPFDELLSLGFVEARQGNSVNLYFHCNSMDEVERLVKIAKNKELEKIIKDVAKGLAPTTVNAEVQLDRLSESYLHVQNFIEDTHSSEENHLESIKLLEKDGDNIVIHPRDSSFITAILITATTLPVLLSVLIVLLEVCVRKRVKRMLEGGAKEISVVHNVQLPQNITSLHEHVEKSDKERVEARGLLNELKERFQEAAAVESQERFQDRYGINERLQAAEVESQERFEERYGINERLEAAEVESQERLEELNECKDRLHAAEVRLQETLEELNAFKERVQSLEARLQSGTLKKTKDESQVVTKTRGGDITDPLMRSDKRESRVKAFVPYLEMFEKHKAFLEEHVDPDFGLLDKLMQNDSLSRRDVKVIEESDKIYERNSLLLKIISIKEKYDCFFEALRDTNQSHIVNYLKGNGEYSSEHVGDWPLSTREIATLNANQEFLVDNIDMYHLLDHLLATGVINRRQREFISSKPTSYEKTKIFVEILSRHSLRGYCQTIRCLQESKQEHIAAVLEHGGVVVRAVVNVSEEAKVSNRIEREMVSKIVAGRRRSNPE